MSSAALIHGRPFPNRQHQLCDDELSCKICLRSYNTADRKPRKLFCQHTFCEACICDFLARAKKRNGFNRQTRESFVSCPLCKSRSQLGIIGVQSLPINSTAYKYCQSTNHQPSPYSIGPNIHITSDPNYKGDHLRDNRSKHSLSQGWFESVVPRRVDYIHPPPQKPEIAPLALPPPAFDDITPASLDDFLPSGVEEDLSDRTRRVGFSDELETISYLPAARYEADMLLSPTNHFRPEGDNLSTATQHGNDIPTVHDLGEGHQFQSGPVSAAEFAGHFGHYMNSASEQEQLQRGAFRLPSSISYSSTDDGRILVVDAAQESTSAVQVFAPNGDCLSAFETADLRTACFIGDGSRLALATGSGMAVCDLNGQVEKSFPVDGDVIALTTFQEGFVAAHHDKLVVCDRYKPTAMLRTVSHFSKTGNTLAPDDLGLFSDITDLASYEETLYVLDGGEVLVLDSTKWLLNQVISPTSPFMTSLDLNRDNRHLVLGDSMSGQVLEYSEMGQMERCLVRLGDGPEVGGTSDRKCGGVCLGSRDPEGVQVLYVVVRGSELAEVQMYRM